MKQQEDFDDELLKSILRSQGIEKAPADFTRRLMNRLEVEPLFATSVYKPILSWKTWVSIGSAISILLLLISIFNSTSGYLAEIIPGTLSGYMQPLSAVLAMPMVITGIICVAGFLSIYFLDKLLLKKLMRK